MSSLPPTNSAACAAVGPLAQPGSAEDLRIWGMAFPPRPRSVGRVRAQVRSVLDEWKIQDETVDALVLVASELVTNGIRVCSSANIVHVQLTMEEGSLLLEVSDPSAIWPCEVAAGPEDESGRGLLLARELAQEFGAVARDHIGKTVCARFTLPAGRPGG